jgi:peroxiredoxin
VNSNIGLSFYIDSTAKQQSFADQYELPYKMMSDADEAARRSFKVDKAFMGLVPGE